MKKILISLAVIVVAGGIVAGATVAYFSDTETSAGNTFTAGAIDLKIDHAKQTYNDIDCNTCTVEVKSDISNQVKGTIDGLDPGPFPHSAVLVSIINPAWTANIPGANWIWWTDPTPLAEYGIDTIYTFEETFNWMGPVIGATLELGISTDNSYEIYLNGHLIAGDNTEQNYNAAGQDAYTGTILSDWIVQGTNTLQFKVKNWLRPADQTWDNPGGLLYKLVIDGNCQDDYFKGYCQLWAEKDLEDERFWDFDDIKPGDEGLNIISLHVFDNDAWACMYLENQADDDNGLVEPEQEAGDLTGGLGEGELSQYIEVFMWWDENEDDEYNAGEEIVAGPDNIYNLFGGGTVISLADSLNAIILEDSETEYLGITWCAGTLNVDTGTGTIDCDGESMGNIAQSDIFSTDIVFYTVQHRNNTEFSCEDLFNPAPDPNPDPN